MLSLGWRERRGEEGGGGRLRPRAGSGGAVLWAGVRREAKENSAGGTTFPPRLGCRQGLRGGSARAIFPLGRGSPAVSVVHVTDHSSLWSGAGALPLASRCAWPQLTCGNFFPSPTAPPIGRLLGAPDLRQAWTRHSERVQRGGTAGAGAWGQSPVESARSCPRLRGGVSAGQLREVLSGPDVRLEFRDCCCRVGAAGKDLAALLQSGLTREVRARGGGGAAFLRGSGQTPYRAPACPDL